MGGWGRGLVKCSLTFKVQYLNKRGAYFETREKLQYTPFDFEIGKCDIFLSVAMFTSYVSYSQTGWLFPQI